MAKNLHDNPDNWIPRELFADYIGGDSEKLLAFYDKAKAKRSALTMSFDLLAILALPAWFGLRRQWTLWATYVGLFGLLPFVEAIARIEVPNGAFVGVGVAMGMMARGLLLMNATSAYAKLRAKQLGSPEIASALAGRARRSVPLAVAGGIGGVIVVLCMTLLADALFPAR